MAQTSDDSDSKSMGTAQPTPNATAMRDKCSHPKNLTHLSTTIQQYVSPSTSILHIKKRSKHAPNLSKDNATETIEVCQLSERNSEHIRPAWISK